MTHLASGPPDMFLTWEYKVVNNTQIVPKSEQPKPLEDRLNDLGRAGWELIETGPVHMLFKRAVWKDY